MADADRFLGPDDITCATTMTIRAVKKEKVDGVPRLVIYFEETPKGLLLTRQIAEDLTEMFGPNPLVEQFLAMN